MFLALFGILSTLSILKYNNLFSTIYDLGLYLNNFILFTWGDWVRVFTNHLHPLLPLWSAIFFLFPSEIAPQLILATQSLLLSLPILGLYRWFGPIPALAYSLYFPIWYSALSDFHMDHMAVPILFAFFFFDKQGKVYHAVAMAILLSFVKETFALQTIFCGIYLGVTKGNKKACLGLMLFGGLYFFLGLEFIQRYFYSYARITTGGTSALTSGDLSPYSWLGATLGEVFTSILTRPHHVLWEIVTNKDKVLYIFYLFGALGFIPLLRPAIVMIAIPPLAISLLSSHHNHFAYNHHYTVGVVAPLTFAFAEGLNKAQGIWENMRLKKTLFAPLVILGLVVAHSLLSPSPLGRKFILEKSWNYHFSIYVPTERNQMIKSALVNFIPDHPDVIVTSQNDLNWIRLFERQHLHFFPEGATEKAVLLNSKHISMTGFLKFIATGKITSPTPIKRWSDYVVIDLQRPWFILDQSCHWVSGACQKGGVSTLLLPPIVKKKKNSNLEFSTYFLSLVAQTKERFETIYENDGFMILKRRLDEEGSF